MRNIKQVFVYIFAMLSLLALDVLAMEASGKEVNIGEVNATKANKNIEIITLKNNKIELQVTPDIGGRVLSFSLRDKNNFLKLGEEVKKNPNPTVNAEAGNIGYFGHEMWVGPQSAWWTQQKVNSERLASQAIWPPDPYLSLGKNKIIAQSAEHLVLEGLESPVSGVQLQKTYSFLKDRPNSLKLDVTTRNIRAEHVAWDIWFNTRVDTETDVYVPVSGMWAVRVDHLTDELIAPLAYRLEQGIFSLDILPPPEGKTSRRGKVFLQPSLGWMAGFKHEQAFIIQFQLQPRNAIHPQQGQVELYLDYQTENPAAGLLEMEVHAPYRTLAPDEIMSATEYWTILSYNGAKTRKAHLDFLRKHAKELGLGEF